MDGFCSVDERHTFTQSQIKILAFHHYFKWQKRGKINGVQTDCICLYMLHLQYVNCFESLHVSYFQN